MKKTTKLLALLMAVVMLMSIAMPLAANAETLISTLNFSYNFKAGDKLNFTVGSGQHVSIISNSCYYRGNGMQYLNGATAPENVQLELYFTLTPDSGYAFKTGGLTSCKFNGVVLPLNNSNSVDCYHYMTGGSIQVHVIFSYLSVENDQGKNIDKSGITGYHIAGEVIPFGAIESFDETGHFNNFATSGGAVLKYANRIADNQVTMGSQNSKVIAMFAKHDLYEEVITKSKIGVEGEYAEKCHKCAYEHRCFLPFVDMEYEGFDDGVTASKTLYYNGKNQYLGVSLWFGDRPLTGDEYNIEYPAESKNVGTYTAKLTVNGTYFYDELTYTYTIYLGKPKVTAKAGVNTVNLSWNKVPGATGYIVYEYSAKTGYKAVANIAKLAFSSKNRTGGTAYSYLVRAYFKNAKGKLVASPFTASDRVNVATLCSAPAPKASVSGKTVALKWAKVNGAKFYRVYQYNTKTKKYTAIGSTTKLSYVMKNQSKGTHYYLVRAFNIKNAGSNFTTKNLVKAVIK